MRLSFLFLTLLFFSACASPEISETNEKTTTKKIQSNQSDASDAQNEYKRLQAQRDKE